MKTNIIFNRVTITILLTVISCFTITCKKDPNSSQQPPVTSDLYPTGMIEDSELQLSGIPVLDTIDISNFPDLSGYKSLAQTVIINVPSPGNQDTLNSCVAWSIGYGLLSYYFKFLEGHSDYNGDDKIFSPSFIYNSLNNHVDNGISSYFALDFIKNHGCCKMKDMPYSSPTVAPPAIAIANAINYKLTDFYRIQYTNMIQMMKTYLAKGYPIIIGVRVDDAFRKIGDVNQFVKQTDGRLVWKNYSDKKRYTHAMLVCGYDDVIKAFKVLNSWGQNWGNSGYIWIDYDFFKTAVVNPVIALPSIYVGIIKRPYLITTGVKNVTSNSAQCDVNITADWGIAVTESGVCWGTMSEPDINGNKTTDGSDLGNYTSSIAGLSSNTKYYIKGYAINNTGISYGMEKSFTTTAVQSGPPVLTTKKATSISKSSAISGGNITSDGASPITSRGVYYSTSTNPTTSDKHTSDGNGTGEFMSSINGLAPKTTYYVMAYATNSYGTGLGNTISFTTSSNGDISGIWEGYADETAYPNMHYTMVANFTQSNLTLSGFVQWNDNYGGQAKENIAGSITLPSSVIFNGISLENVVNKFPGYHYTIGNYYATISVTGDSLIGGWPGTVGGNFILKKK